MDLRTGSVKPSDQPTNIEFSGERKRVRRNEVLGCAPSGSAGVCDEASEGQDKNGRETADAGSLLQPPFDDGASALDCHQTRQSRRYPGDQDEIAQNAERLWRAGNRCHRNQYETKSDSDRGDDVERAGSDGVLGDPDEVRGHEDADSADGQNKQGHDKR
jgi:hypothetical protein